MEEKFKSPHTVLVMKLVYHNHKLDLISRHLASDNIAKLPMNEREGLPPLISSVINNQGIVIGYSNDMEMEVNINCTFPNGDRTVELVYSSEVTPPFMTGWLINKFFPGREQLKWKMAAVFESGILSALEYKEYAEFRDRNPRKKIQFSDSTGIKSLTLEDVQGTLAALVAGYIISIITFIIEVVIGCSERKPSLGQVYKNGIYHTYN